MLGRLGNTSNRGGSGGRTSSTRAAPGTATAGGLGGLQDVVEALLHLVRGHVDEWVKDGNTWAKRALIGERAGVEWATEELDSGATGAVAQAVRREERAVESRRVTGGEDSCTRESGWACANVESVARLMGAFC